MNPVLGLLAVLIGHGWLWGRVVVVEEAHPTATLSTVEIEELDNDEAAEIVVQDANPVSAEASPDSKSNTCVDAVQLATTKNTSEQVKAERNASADQLRMAEEIGTAENPVHDETAPIEHRNNG